jgi:hypothetical protein
MKEFKEPEYFPNDRVCFRRHNHTRVYEGEVTYVETHWPKQGEYYHVYCIQQEGYKRAQWVGVSNIICILKSKRDDTPPHTISDIITKEFM